MIESSFIKSIAEFKVPTYTGVEDFADKFSFIYTVVVLLLCTAIVTSKSYLINPISCYISTEIGGTNLLKYIEDYCWVQGTVPISYSGRMPQNKEQWTELENEKILYYQWVPFVLGLQCCLFLLPRLLWQAICHNRIGTDLQNLVETAASAMHSVGEERQKSFDIIAGNIENLLFQQQKRDPVHCPQRSVLSEANLNIPRSGVLSVSPYDFDVRNPSASRTARLPVLLKPRRAHLAMMYLAVKFLYLLNAVGQILLMQRFLGFNITGTPPIFGLSVLITILQGHDWQLTQIFPRVGFCYAEMQIIGSRATGVTAQCALPMNMLNEKIYIFLWWWILCVILITTYSICIWIFRFSTRSREANYINKYIKFGHTADSFDERDVNDFALKFLRQDGIFLIRMLRSNAGDLVAAAVVNTLLCRFQQRLKEKIRNPFSNDLLSNVGWTTNLEKGGDDSAIRCGLQVSPSVDCLMGACYANQRKNVV